MSSTLIQPYLFFGGRCEEALAFYQDALGAKIEIMMRYNESPQPTPPGMLPAGFENKVMHASFRVGGNLIMASDGNDTTTRFDGISLSISLPTEAETDRVFRALSVGGKVKLPLSQTFWSPRFGMLDDKFGLGWMVGVITPQS